MDTVLEEALSFVYRWKKKGRNKCKRRGESERRRSIGPERKIRSNEFRDVTLTKALFQLFSLWEKKKCGEDHSSGRALNHVPAIYHTAQSLLECALHFHYWQQTFILSLASPYGRKVTKRGGPTEILWNFAVIWKREYKLGRDKGSLNGQTEFYSGIFFPAVRNSRSFSPFMQFTNLLRFTRIANFYFHFLSPRFNKNPSASSREISPTRRFLPLRSSPCPSFRGTISFFICATIPSVRVVTLRRSLYNVANKGGGKGNWWTSCRA